MAASEREKEILRKILVDAGHGVQKRRKEELQQTKTCLDWSTTGKCEFGDKCKYAHGQLKETPEERSRALLRTLAVERGAADDDASPSDAPPGEDGDDEPAEALVVPSVVNPYSALQRYYSTMFKPDADGVRGHDQYVHIQSNRVCIVGLAPSHPIVRQRLAVTSVIFAPAVSAITVSGKRKRGNVFVDAKQVIATVKTACGQTFSVRAGMRGDLLEVNGNLTSHPGILASHPATAGHLAVVNLKLQRVAEVHSSLLAQDDYAELCALRGWPSSFEQALSWSAGQATGASTSARPSSSAVAAHGQSGQVAVAPAAGAASELPAASAAANG